MAECIKQLSLPCIILCRHSMEVEVLGGVGWSTPYPGCFTPRKELVPCVENGGWALGLVHCLQKITSSLGFELQTL